MISFCFASSVRIPLVCLLPLPAGAGGQRRALEPAEIKAAK